MSVADVAVGGGSMFVDLSFVVSVGVCWGPDRKKKKRKKKRRRRRREKA